MISTSIQRVLAILHLFGGFVANGFKVAVRRDNWVKRQGSASGTKHNCLGAHGNSGAAGRPAVLSTWRRQPPLTLTGSSGANLTGASAQMILVSSAVMPAQRHVP